MRGEALPFSTVTGGGVNFSLYSRDAFLFATGYKVGPQFFRRLKKTRAPQVSLTISLCVTSLVATVMAAKVLGASS